MNIIQSPLFRIIVPKFIRKKLVAKVLRANVLKYYAGMSKPLADDITPVLDYLSKNPVAIFPYDFQDQYREEDIEVFEDIRKGLRYVILYGKKLYFKKRWSKKRIRKSFNELSKEQYPRCPHCYINDNFRVDKGDVIVDIGAAEGNFALSHIESASRVILFESDKEWLEPLNATFEPWKDKVVIVNKFVGDVCNSKCATLDSFFQPDEKISVLKIDVEGAESKLFDGCKRILQESRFLKVAVCTYHKPQDEKEFTELLTQYGFETSHSEGFMLLVTDKKIKPPYLRRGLVRAIKTGQA